MATINISNSLKLQHPYLYCQAAGSDGVDGSKTGIHLRWDLFKTLGENHIPKSNLSSGSEGFNKSDDYVALYRTSYTTDGMIVIDFNNLDDNAVSLLENYRGLTYTVTQGGVTNTIIIRCLDRPGFKSIFSDLDPNNIVQDFLNKYDGIIEVEVEGKLLFAYDVTFASGNGTGSCYIETVSIPDRLDESSVRVIKREHKTRFQLLSGGIATTGENIKYIRLQQNGMPAPLIARLHIYEDFFAVAQETSAWTHIGNFGLSLNDNEVFTRFQGQTYNGAELVLPWPKYNEGAFVRPSNYMDRWLNNEDGLKSIVSQFISLSDSDPRANIHFPSDEPDDGENAMTVSLLDMLKLVALDYHGARMLGLGHLDNADAEFPVIYAAVYTTHPALPVVGENIDHVFMTLPTSFTDNRLPIPVQLQDPTYGLYVITDENNPEPQLISDPNGYSLYDDYARFINLSKINRSAPQVVLSFIPTDVKDMFDATVITQPVSFGIEYRLQGEPSWRKPEILHEEEYRSSDDFPESLTTPEIEESPLYTHRESEVGIHEYALYSVNWFSRSSGLSNTVLTDNTNFVKRNTLLPPFNLAVQYIQEEDPLIFTTQAEQNDLAAANTTNPTGDNYKTRVTFEWDNLHNNAYRVADKVEFFFRDTPIQKVEGQINSITAVSDSESLIVSMPYTMASLNPPVTVSPAITPGTESRYIGALLNTPNGQFQIVAITQPVTPGNGPSFRVKNLVTTEAMQANPDDPMITTQVYTQPEVNDLFFIFENVSEANQWTKLNRTVNLVNFSNQSEIILEDDGSTHNEIVGGINGNATITEITDIAGATGGYTIQFNSGIDLNAHPDNTITWNRGSARFVMAALPGKKKRLPVMSIQQTNSVRIVVYDPDYAAFPDQRIQVGTNIPVNFHPGYKLYLSAEPGVFDKPRIMPQGTANNKKTYFAARSADSTMPYYSSLTPPAVIVARNIQKPIMPVAALGPLFATRPDFYGKSTYTIDVQLNITDRIPFGIVVYRANEMSILQALYKPQTVTQIIADLAAIENNDPLKFNRWRSLVEVETDPANNNQFRLFDAYRFPNPDNADTFMFTGATTSVNPFPLQGSDTILGKKATIKRVIEDVFNPLTETPVIFEYLKTGYQTSSAQPKTRSIIGRLLSPADTEFNPYPMAVKFPAVNPHTVRFTDYTLSGNARNIYFYFAREIAVDTKLSERTPISGPIVLVDAAPAEKPVIRKVVAQEGYTTFGINPAVKFDLADYIAAEKIKQFQVFRTTNFAQAATVRTMQLAAVTDAGDEVEDTFSDLPFPPYGQPVYYRLVALREIINERGEMEMIPSQPSEMVLTNISDAVNPVAPPITAQIGSTQTSGTGQVIALLNVMLRWPQTVYNGTYHLYKMNSRGNWEKLWSKKTNAALIEFPENGDFVTWPQTANLPKVDAEGNTIYHKFKVMVENASGLFNLEDKELAI